MRNLFRFILFAFFIFTISSAFANQELIIEPDQGTRPLIRAINNAKSSIDLVMYGLTNLQFVEALNQASYQGKQVNVLLQEHPYKAYDENTNAIEQFQKNKINLQWPSNQFKLTHQKTFIIDDNYAIIMTFNLTHSTFKNERNFALLIDDPAIVQEIKQVFHADWQHKDITVNNPNLLWSPDNSRDKLLTLIHEAKSEIKLYAEGLNDYQIIGALAKASRHGVNIEILTSTRDEKTNNKKAAYLSRAGVTIRFSNDYMIHAKVMLLDHSKAVIGSINMTKPSIDNNRELSIITEDPKIIRQLEETFHHDWQHATASPHVPSKTTEDTYVLLRSVKQLIKLITSQHHTHRPIA